MSGMNSTADQEEDMDDDDEEEEQTNVPAALARWRRAVAETESAAQLLLCAMQLNRAIAWEKSIMKVVSSICNILCNYSEKKYWKKNCSNSRY